MSVSYSLRITCYASCPSPNAIFRFFVPTTSCWVSAADFCLPFLALFFKQQGLSGTQIGLLSTFAGLAALIAAPLWGRFSDAASKPRRLLQFELLASACLMLVLSQQVSFGWIAVIVVLDALLNAGSSPSSDALALAVLSKVQSGFGSVRLFASLGWAITAFVSGWLSERFGLIVAFVGYAVGYISGSGSVGLIRLPSKKTTTSSGDRPKRSLRQSIRAVLSDPRLRKLALALGIFLFMMYGLRSFESLYLKQLGAGEAVVGLMSTIGATIELPGMLWADRLVKRYGAVRLLRYSFLLEVVRLTGVLLVPSVPTLVVMRVVGGILVQLVRGGRVLVYQRSRTRAASDHDAGPVQRDAGFVHPHDRRAHQRLHLRSGRRLLAVCAGRDRFAGGVADHEDDEE